MSAEKSNPLLLKTSRTRLALTLAHSLARVLARAAALARALTRTLAVQSRTRTLTRTLALSHIALPLALALALAHSRTATRTRTRTATRTRTRTATHTATRTRTRTRALPHSRSTSSPRWKRPTCATPAAGTCSRWAWRRCCPRPRPGPARDHSEIARRHTAWGGVGADTGRGDSVARSLSQPPEKAHGALRSIFATKHALLRAVCALRLARFKRYEISRAYCHGFAFCLKPQ